MKECLCWKRYYHSKQHLLLTMALMGRNLHSDVWKQTETNLKFLPNTWTNPTLSEHHKPFYSKHISVFGTTEWSENLRTYLLRTSRSFDVYGVFLFNVLTRLCMYSYIYACIHMLMHVFMSLWTYSHIYVCTRMSMLLWGAPHMHTVFAFTYHQGIPMEIVTYQSFIPAQTGGRGL